MRYYKEIEIPEYCFLSEIVEWVAFGRVPEKHEVFDDDEILDCRFYPKDMPDNFNQPPYGYYGFSKAEAEAHGIEFTSEYETALDRSVMSDFISVSDEFKERWPHLVDPEQEERASLNQKVIDDFHALFDFSAERAWSTVFQRIATGEIALEGMSTKKWEVAEKEADEEAEASNSYWDICRVLSHVPFEPIPPKLIRLGLDWRENQIPGQDGFFNLRTKTECIKAIPSIGGGSQCSGKMYGGFFILDAGANSTHKASIARRGRAPSFDWSLARSYLLSEHIKGLLPGNKESAAHHVVAFCESKGKKVGLTTVKEQLRDELALVFDPSAEISAENKTEIPTENINGKAPS